MVGVQPKLENLEKPYFIGLKPNNDENIPTENSSKRLKNTIINITETDLYAIENLNTKHSIKNTSQKGKKL